MLNLSLRSLILESSKEANLYSLNFEDRTGLAMMCSNQSILHKVPSIYYRPTTKDKAN